MQVVLFLLIGAVVTLEACENPGFLGTVVIAYVVLLGVRRV